MQLTLALRLATPQIGFDAALDAIGPEKLIFCGGLFLHEQLNKVSVDTMTQHTNSQRRQRRWTRQFPLTMGVLE